jgi:hypothetical protein
MAGAHSYDLCSNMTSNENSVNHKVIDLDEIYNFHIKFISIQIYTKNYDFLKTGCPLPPFETRRWELL